MIITGNSAFIGAAQTANGAPTTGTTAPTLTPSPAKQPTLITPKVDVSRWLAGRDSVKGTPEWNVIRGQVADVTYAMNFTAKDSLGKWEIQHAITGIKDLVNNGGRIRFGMTWPDYDERFEGKELLTVQLVLPDDIFSPYIEIPPATPDKPDLVAGFILKCVNGKFTYYNLDGELLEYYTPKEEVHWYSDGNFDMSIDNGYLRVKRKGSNNYDNLSFKNIRAKADTPVSTLSLSSGNPAKETAFSYFETIIPRENITHTLTLDDEGTVFYVPWGANGTLSLVIPDTPFPQGFSVTLLTEQGNFLTACGENRNVIITKGDGNITNGYASAHGSDGSYDGSTDNKRLIQTGTDGKTWLII
ncbi:hypothetical protein AAA88_004678 [Salmonella enterica subsp. diarizonae]|nr:hypothetical protein [Salmonella enterica subsp. diarizonae]